MSCIKFYNSNYDLVEKCKGKKQKIHKLKITQHKIDDLTKKLNNDISVINAKLDKLLQVFKKKFIETNVPPEEKLGPIRELINERKKIRITLRTIGTIKDKTIYYKRTII